MVCCAATWRPRRGMARCCHWVIWLFQRTSKAARRCSMAAFCAGICTCKRAASALATSNKLRGSRCTCGLPSACTSPAQGVPIAPGCGSIMFTWSEANSTSCTLALPDRCKSLGNQPASSEAPVHTAMSACLNWAISAGLASMWCGSCSECVATCTRASGNITRVSAAHSGSQANTVKAAAGPAIHIPIKVTDTIRKPATRPRHLKRVRTVGSKGQHVLKLDRTLAGV